MDRIAPLEQMLEADPADSLGWFLLGGEYAAVGRHAEAATACRKGLALDANHTASWKRLGDALRLSGDDAGAIDAYRTGVETAERTGDLQVKKECLVFLRKLGAA